VLPVRTAIFASPGWTLFVDGGRLFASAGADEMYLLDALSAPEAECLLDGYRAGTLEELASEAACYAEAIDRLLKAGVVFRGTPTPQPLLKLAVVQCGVPAGDWQAALLAQEESWALTADADAADLCLVLRVDVGLGAVAEATRDLRVPHLLVDLGNQHTLSLGPLVKPGKTACLSCLAGKISRHWGDPPVPRQPQMGGQTQLVTALVAHQVRRFQRYGTCPELVERLWSFDLNTLEGRFDRLFQLPWCPRCFPDSTACDAGDMPLPWS
jgi:hypothetical protein